MEKYTSGEIAPSLCTLFNVISAGDFSEKVERCQSGTCQKMQYQVISP